MKFHVKNGVHSLALHYIDLPYVPLRETTPMQFRWNVKFKSDSGVQKQVSGKDYNFQPVLDLARHMYVIVLDTKKYFKKNLWQAP